MANARSRKRRGLSEAGVIFIGPGKRCKTKKKNLHKCFTLPLFINWGADVTPEITSAHWHRCQKQSLELAKNRKQKKQTKGVGKPYKMHYLIQNLYPSSY
ncbi:MAG: hypothetical protein PHO65_01805 [Sulfurovum sp.]|nr:hypothetical protein [Sulfurovum sp.]